MAQDLKPADRAKLAAVADTAQKLVLAPEQRIEDGAAKFATVRRPSRRAAFPPVDAVLADVTGGAIGREPDTPATQGFSLGEASARAEAEARMQAQDAEWRELEARAAAAEAAQQAALEPQAWDGPSLQPDDGSYEDADGYNEAPALDVVIDPNARLFDMAPNAFAGTKLDAVPEPQWQNDEPETLDEVEIAPTEPDAPQSLHGTIEPDEAWANAAEARVIAELAGEAVEEEVFEQAKEAFREPNFSSAPPQSAPEVLFDEEVLRAMVQAIFREEMAGPMGERITRNIRKLVRAEVGRMLAAQELE